MKPFKLSAIALALMATSMSDMAADQTTTSRMATAVVTAGRGADECRYILHTDKIIAFKRLLGLRFTQQDVDYDNPPNFINSRGLLAGRSKRKL
jgi:hypothetical protein